MSLHSLLMPLFLVAVQNKLSLPFVFSSSHNIDRLSDLFFIDFTLAKSIIPPLTNNSNPADLFLFPLLRSRSVKKKDLNYCTSLFIVKTDV